MTLQYFWPYCSFKNIEPESNRKRIEKEKEEENLIESKFVCLVELSLGIMFGLVSRLLASHIGKKRNGHWELDLVWFGMIGVDISDCKS